MTDRTSTHAEPGSSEGNAAWLFDRWPPRPWLRIGIVSAVLLAVIGQVFVQITFAQVNHPVTLLEANTTADPAALREQYRVLIDQDTLGAFRLTESVDFLWAGGVAATMFLAAIAIGRRHPYGSFLRRLAYLAAPVLALGGVLDMTENTVSIVMLADPWGFPDGLAPFHAGLATVKLPAIVAGVSFLMTHLLVIAIRWFRRRPHGYKSHQPTRPTDQLGERDVT